MAAHPGTVDPGTVDPATGGPATGGAGGDAPAAAGPVLSLGHDDRVVLCCAGSGIRAATFGLGVLQALQQAPLWARVRTIVAVSGGAYIAAARTLAARDRADRAGPHGAGQHGAGQHGTGQHGTGQHGGSGPDPVPYAPRSPEERHLRNHTRYLLENWQVTVRGLATLTRGVIVNTLLVGSVYFIAGHIVGWFLHEAGLITGLRTGSPDGQLGWWPVLPAVAAVVTVVLAWRRALPPEPGPQSPSRWAAWLRRGGPPGPSNAALGITLGLAFALIAAPLLIRGLYTVSLGNSTWGVITRFLGFANADACKDAAQTQAHACGAATAGPAAVPALVSNGSSGSTLSVKLATFATFAAAVVTLARTTLGRLRTYQGELSKSGTLARWGERASHFIRRRVVPWLGSALVVGAILILTLRWIADAATRAPLDGGWRSAAAECLYAALLFPLLKLITDINSTSAHGFYRDRLATVYGTARDGDQAVPVPDPRLSSLAGVDPELVICAAANTTRPSQAATARGAVSFTFTPSDVGLSQQPVTGPPDSPPPGPQGRAPTADFEQATRLRLFGAVAVSSAAISPVMGKMTRPAMRILLAAADARLGVWLPNPAHFPAGRWMPGPPPRSRLGRLGATAMARLRQPDFLHLWAEAAGALRLDGRWLYVTDGAHYESLGLVEALRRRPDHVIVVDATGDGTGWFATLGQAIAEARAETGVQLEIDPGGLAPDPQTHRCAVPYAVGRFRYPDEPGLGDQAGDHQLLYLKLAVPAGAPWDVLSYQDIHPAFPAASTLQQLYDDQEFEAYRALGQHCATELARAVSAAGPPLRVAPEPGQTAGASQAEGTG
jgi:hypothetical protein